ncbi:hypothetical protein D3C85_382540 [compost metagenome]
MLGREAGVGLAVGHRVLYVFAGVIGVAARHRPVRRDLPAGLGFDAPAAHFPARDVVAVITHARPFGILLGAVLLLDLKHRQGHVQRAIRQFALDARFVVGAGDGVQRLAFAGQLALGLEHLRIAAIERPLRVQVHDQTAVGRELGVDLLARAGRGLVPPAHAPAQHQGDRIRQRKAAHAIHALLLQARFTGRCVGADAGLRHAMRVPVEYVYRHVQGRRQHAGVLLGRGALRVAAQQQFMTAPEQLDRTADVGIHAGLGVVEFIGPAHQPGTQTGLPVDGAIGTGVLQVAVGGQIIGADLGGPAITKAVLQVGEHAGGVPVEAIPGGIQIRGPGQADIAAVLVARHAGHVGRGADALGLHAGGQHGTRPQVHFANRVEQGRLLIGHVVEIAPVFHRADNSPAHAAAVVQGAAQIGLGAIAVPASGADHAVEGELALRPLAHQVHGGGRVARAMHQAIGAPQDFHPFVHRHVLRRRGHIAHQHGHAVLLERIHLETARVVRRGQQLIGLHRDAGGMLHDVVEALQVLFAHLLQPDHRDRLRNFSHGQRQLGQGGSVLPHAFSADRHRRQ